MKLVVFSPYYPPHIGGLESHSDEFNKYLSRKGVEITVFTPRFPHRALETEIRHNNVKIIRFPAFEIISNYPLPKFWSPKFWRPFFALFKEDFDIVISRTRFFNTSLLALIYAKIKKIRWIHIEHGSDFVQLSSSFKTAVARCYDWTFGKLIFKKADLNISISKAVQEFVNKFDKRESPIIYRGLDFDEIDKITSDFEMKKICDDKIIISFVGRLYKWKGVETSIEAIKSLPGEIKNKIIFLIVGDGEDFSILKKLAENESCIRLLGNLPREKAIAILKITDIYLHSAEPGGGLSTSLLEAIYCGCGIIATPNEGAQEVLGDIVDLIPAGNSNLLAQNIVLMVRDEKTRKEFSNLAKNKITDEFDWEKAIEKYLNILTTR